MHHSTIKLLLVNLKGGGHGKINIDFLYSLGNAKTKNSILNFFKYIEVVK